MAVSLINGFSIRVATPVSSSVARARSKRTRRITPEAGRALEILGHAIEYLTDEFVHAGKAMSSESGEVAAVQLLMAVNRQVYYECPEVLSVTDRLRAMLHLHAA